MAKNLKDIVDEGFSQLAVLAERRMEILARAEKIGSAASGDKGAEAELKVKTAESHFLFEMNSRVEQLLEELRRSLAQVADGNASYHSGLRNNLKLHVSGILAELARTKSHLLNGTRERLDLLLLELEKEFQSDKSVLGQEASRLLSELDSFSQGNQSALRQSQAEIASRLSRSEHEVSALLGKAFDQIVQGTETKRQEVADFLESLYRRQVEKLESSTAELNMRVSPLIREQCEKMQDSCINSQKDLNKIRDTILSSSSAELRELSKEPLSELEHRNDDSRQLLSEKLSELRELSTRLLKQEQQSLSERNSGIADSADEIYSALIKFDTGVAGNGRSRIEDAFNEISVEFSGLAGELNGKLKQLLNTQSDGLGRLSSSADKGFSDLVVDLKTQLQELIKVQNQLCAQKEDELFLQLQNLEKKISETYSLFRDSGYSSKRDGNGSGGGLKE